MAPLLFFLAGIVALAVGVGILRSLGSGYRVGRLLAATPVVSVAEANTLAAGHPRYVAVRGRIDAEAEFEDDAHRPLVLRRARIQLAAGDGWRTVDEHLEVVPFSVREGLDSIDIDHSAIDEGLVVVPRESVGVASDAPERVPPDTAPDTPMRLRIEQVSSVEHATIVGVPLIDPTRGSAHLSAGLGRPLILTTLEPPEAMRILAAAAPRRPLAAAIALGIGLVGVSVGVALALLAATTGAALAASPEPTRASGGDPRSSGEGPGLVGDPLTAIVVVIAIAVLAIVLTTAYVRITADRRG